MLFEEIVYGPIHSRRLGVSLGINLMPQHGKICSFDCIYCECGYNAQYEDRVLPTREQVREALETKLTTLERGSKDPRKGVEIDVITFSGNGEPTLHPDFEGIIIDTCALRDLYCPAAKVSVLSNSTQLGRADVVRALKMCDNRILKLDSAIDRTMHLIDEPVNKNLTVADIKAWLSLFDGDFTLQTCFLRGTLSAHYGDETEGIRIDNTTEEELQAWYEAVDELHPKQVMIYVIDRATPEKQLEKISREQMEAIADVLRNQGIEVSVSA